jgi:hypothetical protein
MNTAELLDAVIEIYKESFGQQIALSMIFSIIFSVILFVVIFLGVIAVMATFIGNIGYSDFNTTMMILSVAVFIILILFASSLHSALYSTGNIILAYKSYIGEKPSLKDIVKQCFKKFIPVLTVIFAQFIVLIPLFVFIAALSVGYFYYLFNMINTGFTDIWLAIIITVLFIIALLITGIISMTITIASVPIAIFEKKYFMSAVSKGFALIKKDFKKILGTVAIYYLVMYIASYSFSAFLGIGKAFIELLFPRDIAAFLSVSTVYFDYMFSAVFSVILTPLNGIFSAAVYINQKIKYEGFDISLKLDDLKSKNMYQN